jgi:hypothetical protein
MFLSSDSIYILLSLYGFWCIDSKFGHLQGFKNNLKVQDKPADVFCEKECQKYYFYRQIKTKSHGFTHRPSVATCSDTFAAGTWAVPPATATWADPSAAVTWDGPPAGATLTQPACY